MKTASLAEVKAHLSGYVRSSATEPVVITRNGKPAAVLLAVVDEDDLERLLMAYSPKLQAILESARKRIRAGKGIAVDQFWKEVSASNSTAKPETKSRRRT